MAIAKNPKRNQPAANDQVAEAFISGAGIQETDDNEQNKKPITLRIDPDILKRIDRAAKRLGISRSAFMVSSSVEKMERMD